MVYKKLTIITYGISHENKHTGVPKLRSKKLEKNVFKKNPFFSSVRRMEI